MSFIQIQIIIFFTIIISSLLAGKKALFISTIVWIIETFMIYNLSASNHLQLITLSLTFQIGLLIAIIRDFIVAKIKKNRNKQINES